MKYGFKKGDGLLNDSGVCTNLNEVERINFLKGWKGGTKYDNAVLEIVTTPNGKFLAAVSCQFGNGGFGSAPSLSSPCFDKRMDAIRYGFDTLMKSSFIDSDKARSVIEDNYYQMKDDEEQLTLF